METSSRTGAGVLAALLVASLVPFANAQRPAPTAAGLLNATLWVQSASEYRALALQTYAVARVNLDRALADPSWTAIPGDDDNDGQPTAIIVDVDETVLDNSPYQARLIEDEARYGRKTWQAWVEEKQAAAVPGALAFLKYVQSRGVTVFYVTNRRDDEREATRNNLAMLGFPLVDDQETLYTRSGPGTKEPRRQAIAKDHRVLLLLGDNLNDFAAAFERKPATERNAAAKQYADWWGTRWLVFPNPMYGSWEGASLGDQWRARGAERERLKIEAMTTKRAKRPARTVAPPVASTDGAAPRPTAMNAQTTAPTTAARAALDGARDDRISSGPMPGYADLSEVSIWLQLRRAATVQLRYWPRTNPGAARLGPARRVDAACDHLATVRLTHLTPGTRYDYEVYLDGTRAAMPYPLTFATQADWRYRTDPPAITFLTGSCAYVNEKRFDRPGRPYGGGEEIFEAMADQRADFMVWTGDNTYFRPADLSGERAMRYRYRHTRSLPLMQRFLASTQHYAVWDDHDFGPDNSDRSFRWRREALAIFRDYWPVPDTGTLETPGCFHRFVWGDCEFFMLDDRYHRSANDMPDGPDKTYLGPGQLRWLQEGLASSRATFKFIVNGNQVLNDHTRYESYGKFAAERGKLLDFLAQAKVSGVLFITGDRHQCELLRRERGGTYPLYDFTVSPLTSGGAYQESEKDNPERVEGTWVTRKRNFGKIQVTGPRRDRVLTLSVHDTSGKTLWERSIKATDLRAPRN